MHNLWPSTNYSNDNLIVDLHYTTENYTWQLYLLSLLLMTMMMMMMIFSYFRAQKGRDDFCFFVPGSLCRRDGIVTSGRFASSFIHRYWFGRRKDHLRENRGPSVGGHIAVVQFLHGSFGAVTTSRYLRSRIQHVGRVCGSARIVGWLFYWAYVNCDV